jgi:tetratricopeptide (TPR) repeat protein
VKGEAMNGKRVAAWVAVLALVAGSGCASKPPAQSDEQYRKSMEKVAAQPPPSSPFAAQLFEAGIQAYRAGECERAIETWRRAIAAGGAGWPYTAEAHYNIGLCYVQMGRTPWAIPELEKSVAVRPDFYDAHFTLANLYIAERRYDDATRALAACTRLKENDPALYTSLGLSYLNTVKYAEAAGALATALSLDPGRADATEALENVYRVWGATLAGQGDYEGAAAKYGQALALNTGNAQTHLDLARVYMQLGEFDHAMELYARAREIDPALAEKETGTLSKIALAGSKDPRAHIEMGDLLVVRGQFREAAEQYEQAIALNPKDVDRYLKLARFYAGTLKDRESAVRWYSRFIEAAPEDARVAMIRKEIARETAPPPDPNRKPRVARMEAGTTLDAAEGRVADPGSRFPVGSRVYRVATIENLWGKHSVIKRAIKPGGGTLYEENVIQEFFVERFPFVSVDRLSVRGVWRQEWIVDGVPVGTIEITVY